MISKTPLYKAEIQNSTVSKVVNCMNQVQGHQNHMVGQSYCPRGRGGAGLWRLCWVVVPALSARRSVPAQQRCALKAADMGTEPQRVAVNDSERCCGASWLQAGGGNRCQPEASRVPCAPAPNRRRGWGVTSLGTGGEEGVAAQQG